MFYSPDERDRVAKILREKTEYTEEEKQRVVDNLFAIAEELHKVWLRHISKAQKLAPPQRTEGGEARSPPS